MGNDIIKVTLENSFEKTLSERIKKDIGELIPNDVLAGIVSKAIQKAFFEERKIEGRFYGQDKTEVPWLVELAKELLADDVKKQVVKWFADNNEVVKEQVKKLMDDGFAKCLLASLDNVFRDEWYKIIESMEERIRSLKND